MSKYSTITSKGTITLPAQFRSLLGLTTGEKVQVPMQGQKIVVERAFDWNDLDAFREKITSRLPADLAPVSDVSAMVADGAAERYARRRKKT